MCCECCKKCCGSIYLWMSIAGIGLFVGILAGVMFAAPPYLNFNAAGFAFVSAVFAGLTLLLHIKHKRNTLARWLPYLRSIMLSGCFAQLAGVAGSAAYIALGIVKHQDLSNIYGENYWIALVWSWMTWKWGFSLFFFSRKYKRMYESSQLLPKDSGEEGYEKSTYDAATPADGEVNE